MKSVRACRGTIAVFLTLIGAEAFAEETPWLTMNRYQADLASGAIAVYRASGWQLPSCPNAQIVKFVPDNTSGDNRGYDVIFSTIMMAYSSGITLSFRGDCDPAHSNRILGTYVTTEQN